jgi:hypothetical protein
MLYGGTKEKRGATKQVAMKNYKKARQNAQPKKSNRLLKEGETRLS